jgi:hypothetical protein
MEMDMLPHFVNDPPIFYAESGRFERFGEFWQKKTRQAGSGKLKWDYQNGRSANAGRAPADEYADSTGQRRTKCPKSVYSRC